MPRWNTGGPAPTVIVSGEHYVNETVGLSKLAKTRKADVHFDSEEEFFDYADQVKEQDESQQEALNKLRNYIYFWANAKGQENLVHRQKSCWRQCEQCGNCRNCKHTSGWRFRCMCDNGLKMLSPYRIVFLNNSERIWHNTKIYQLGIGWVPRKNQVFKSQQGAKGLDV